MVSWGENMITIYIDVLFAVNFLVNILIVEGAAVIVGEETKWYRTLISSAVGALCSVLMFFPDFKFITSMGMKLFLSVVMVLCAYRVNAKIHFLKLLGSFYLASFVFAGGLVALMTMTELGSKTGAVYSNGTLYFDLPWQICALACGVLYALIWAIGLMRKRKITKKAAERRLAIFVQGKWIETKAIIDTGNSLFDPITGDPVIVCEYEQIKSLVPKSDESLTQALRNAGLRVRLVPFTSVGTESGLMPAFCPDKVKVDERETKKCIVGLSETRLSKTEDYHALLNPAIILK